MTEPSPLLVTQWAVCGITAAAARFVPVPLVDDVIREQAAHVAVIRTVRAHGDDTDTAPLEPLWDDDEVPGDSVRKRMKAAALKVVLFPVRKYVAIFGAVHGVPNDVMRVVLLARTVDRRLGRGELTGTDAERTARAREVRTAIEAAIDGMDLRVLTAALADGLSQGKGLTKQAVAYARRLVRRGGEASLPAEGEVGAGAERVTEVLRRPEITRLLEDFDTRVDRALSAA